MELIVRDGNIIAVCIYFLHRCLLYTYPTYAFDKKIGSYLTRLAYKKATVAREILLEHKTNYKG